MRILTLRSLRFRLPPKLLLSIAGSFADAILVRFPPSLIFFLRVLNNPHHSLKPYLNLFRIHCLIPPHHHLQYTPDNHHLPPQPLHKLPYSKKLWR